MRLTCPNCDAQYEVDDNAIPESGRDVQCSSCGHAWFQLPPDVEENLRDEAQTFGDGHAPKPEPEPAPEPETAPQPAAETEEPPEEFTEPEPEDAPEPELPAAAARRPLDSDVKSLLREEAEREIAARQAEGTGLETQPDLGLSAPPATATPAAHAASAGDGMEIPEVDEETRRQVAAMMSATPGGATPVEDGTAPAEGADEETDGGAQGPRRNLLPDIEEINSTLRATSERDAGEPGASADTPSPVEERRGFRRGFLTILLIAVLLAVLYLYAPKIAQKVPAAAGPLNSYVQTVDKGRLWLNGMMMRATSAIKKDSGQPAGN